MRSELVNPAGVALKKLPAIFQGVASHTFPESAGLGFRVLSGLKA